jgi:hypothetical protein
VARLAVPLPPETPLDLDPPSLAISPDGEWLGFFADGKLKKVAVSGGLPVVLCDALAGRGGTWGENGTIVFAPEYRGGLYAISATGGVSKVLTTPDSKKSEGSYRWPHLLPGGNEVLFTILGTTKADAKVVVQSVKTGDRHVLIRGAGTARYVPTGHVIYSQNGALMAAPFNLRRLELTGAPVPVIENIAESVAAGFDSSRFGSLVYIPQAAGRHRRYSSQSICCHRTTTYGFLPGPLQASLPCLVFASQVNRQLLAPTLRSHGNDPSP